MHLNDNLKSLLFVLFSKFLLDFLEPLSIVWFFSANGCLSLVVSLVVGSYSHEGKGNSSDGFE